MNINQHNYEAFFLDYTEGNLSVEMTAELLLFLEHSPTIKEGLEGFEMIKLNSENKTLANKNALKVRIDKSNIEKYIIGSIEGVNCKNDEEDLSLFIENYSESKLLFNRYKKTILTPPVVVFPTKKQLKKRSRVVYLYPLISAAASLLLYFTVYSNKPISTYNVKSIVAIENTFSFEKETEKMYVAVIPEELPLSIQKETFLDNFKKKKDSTMPVFIESQHNLEIANTEKESISPSPLKEITAEILIVAIDTSEKMEEGANLAIISPKNKELTINEWINRQVRKKVLKQDADNTTKIEKDEVFDALANGFNKITKQEIAYNSIASETSVTKGFSIGNLEFSRTKRN